MFIYFDFLGKKMNFATEMRFVSFFSRGFTTMAVMNPENPPKKKQKKRTSVRSTF